MNITVLSTCIQFDVINMNELLKKKKKVEGIFSLEIDGAVTKKMKRDYSLMLSEIVVAEEI